MTTRALRKMDNYGGIDNYILSLDEKAVEMSKSITRTRLKIGAALYKQGTLSERMIKRIGLDNILAEIENPCFLKNNKPAYRKDAQS
jgi:hypothetical protein